MSRLSGESKKLQAELNAEYIASILTDEDVQAWHDEARCTEHVELLVDEYGPFEIWGSRQGAEPLTVKML